MSVHCSKPAAAQGASGFVRTPIARALLGGVFALGVAGAPLTTHAADAVAGVTQTERKTFSIPAGDLDQALSLFGVQAGVLISVDSTLTTGKRSAGASGEYRPAEALEILLRGTQLAAIPKDDGSYALRALPPEDATLLPSVKVQATLDTGVTEGSGSLTTSGPIAAATGLGLTLRETPQSVTVITRDRIEQQNLNSLAEVAEQVTGVFFNGTGTPIGGRTLMYARGYAIDSYQVDGVNLPWEALAESEQYGHGGLDTAIYDSIAVVRGSTGLMTGTGEPSALMALTRKKPTRELQTSLEATLGSWDRHRVVADVGGALNESGSVRGRVVGAYDESDTWVDNYSSKRSIFYGVLEMDLGPRTLMTLTLEHGTADSKGAPWAFDYGVYFYFADGVTPIPPSTTTNIAPHWAYSNSDRTYASAALAHQFNADWNARLSYGFGKFNTDMRRGMVRRIPQDGSLTAARVLSLDYEYDTHVVDARIDGKYRLFGRQHELVAGINVYRNDKAFPLAYYGDPFPDLASWNNGQLNYKTPDWDSLVGSEGDIPGDTEVKQDGVYIVTRLRPLDRLAVILGGRVTNWETLSSDRNPYFVYDDREYKHEFTPYAGVVVDLTRAFSAYASYTQIFQPQEVQDINGRPLDPEEGNTYELGLKSDWFEGRLNASAAVFESKRDNLAVLIQDENGPILNPKGNEAYRAEDQTKGRGWELEVAGALTPRWQLQAGYSQFKNRDSTDAILDTTQPVQQFKLYTGYEPALVPGLTLGASLRWQDDTRVTGITDPLYTIDNYFVVGANLGYALTRNISLALAIDNVFDEEYRVSNYSHSYGEPLNATFSVRARF